MTQGPVARREVEGTPVPHPPGKQSVEGLLEFPGHVERAGGSGTIVRGLVAAADREPDSLRVQMEGEGLGAVFR